jgi:hypothetical protein
LPLTTDVFAMISSQTPPPFGASTWPPEILTDAVDELRREFPTHLPERIVRAIDSAARVTRPDAGQVRLHQMAREILRDSVVV